jgi:hypothetical protein
MASAFELLQQLSQSMRTSSCLPQEPFIKLGSGTAPTLNYQMEQKSGFTTYGAFYPDIPNSYYESVANEVPNNNFYQLISNQERETVERLMAESLLMNKQTSRLLPRFAVKAAAAHTKTEAVENQNINGNVTKSIGVNTADTIICGLPYREIVETVIRENKMPVFGDGMGNYTGTVDFIAAPITPNPTIFIIEEYTTASFLGSYGAGKVIKTMDLLPGEERTYTVTSFRESISTLSRAENVLESFNEDSTREMQNSIDNENSTSATDASAMTHSGGVSVSASGKLLGVSAEVSGEYNFSKNNSANRTANVNSVARALDRHVQNSNNHRELNVNTNSTSTLTERNEEVTVRKFQNINKSRVLNIVFRQLLQEYVTITYLSNIRVGFTNGYTETMQVMDIEEVQTLLDTVVLAAHHADALGKILMHYCKVRNHAGDYIPFIEKKTISYGDCIDGFSGTEIFYGKIAGNLDTYTTGGLSIPIAGVILNVQKHILRTDSVVADALLGQGEALDCFNMRLQDAEAMKAHLTNAELLQKMEIIHNQEFDKAGAYKKVFGSCCETPQSQIIT